MVAYIMRTTLDFSPAPNHMRNRVKNPMAGIKRKKSMSGSKIRRSSSIRPIMTPAGMPITIPSTQPEQTLFVLIKIYLPRVPSKMISFIPASVSHGLGRKSTVYSNEAIPHTVNKTAQVSIPFFARKSNLP